MKTSLGLMFLQGYVATPTALGAVAPDLVSRIADQIEAARPRPSATSSPAEDARWAEQCAAC